MTATLYVGRGRTLTSYDLDPDDGTLTERSALALPNTIQFGRPHPRLPVLYVSCGEPPPGSDVGDWVCAVALRPGSGAPALLADPVRIAGRALHLTTDTSGAHLVLAHTRPAVLSVLRLGPGGAIGAPVGQRPDLELGVFPHQVRVTPDDRFCLCVCRGLPSPHPWRASREPQTAPGSLHVLDLDAGRLGASVTVTVGDGTHFGPRNLDTDATGSTYYLALETQNELLVLGTDADGRPDPTPRQRLSTLAHPEAQIHQGVGPVLVHPGRAVVYVANRAYRPGAGAPRVIPAAAENSIVAYAIDGTGLLRELQRIDSGGVCPRTMSLDPTGRTLVVANSETYRVGDDDGAPEVGMNLATFRVLDDGRLAPLHRLPVGDGSGPEIAWSGIATHP
ncbi:lactonase family protein [Nakamurella deserti]|uniref:lactonase family protein n=1 Tax=Nakamurella deserti TaxID=2164074 RepID=UPI000DBE2CEE|nr:beta-propeller fold lactonase family protein [Nakamurella deserti]